MVMHDDKPNSKDFAYKLRKQGWFVPMGKKKVRFTLSEKFQNRIKDKVGSASKNHRILLAKQT